MNNFLEFRGYRIPEVLVRRTGGGDTAMARFEKISDWHIKQLDRHIGIQKTDNVVEIGCGIGRVAIPLTERLSEGSYIGTETINASINWCQENISSVYSNFSFIHHDIHDDLHNPKGILHARDIRLPSDDASVDLIVLHSVFTHMFRDEITHYLKEFRRILKPSGRVWASFFLANEEILKAMADEGEARSDLAFPHLTKNGERIRSISSPRAAVLFSDSALVSMVAKSGLIIEDILHGSWSGMRSSPNSRQDAVILRTQQSTD